MGMDMYIKNNDNDELFYTGNSGWHVFSFFKKHGDVDLESCDLTCKLTKDILAELIDVCCEVITHPERASELLPCGRWDAYTNAYYRTLLTFVLQARYFLETFDFENDELTLRADW